MERLVLVGGHESSDGDELGLVTEQLGGSVATSIGTPLAESVTRAIATGDTVFVVPMTLGRDPSLMAETARSLRWIVQQQGARDGGAQPPRIVLTEAFGTSDHLTSMLRTAASRIAVKDPQSAMAVVSRVGRAHDDAELHRIAHMVRVNGSGIEVDVALLDHDYSLVQSQERLRRIGFDRVVVVEPSFAPRYISEVEGRAGIDHYGPLISASMFIRIVNDRVADARHRLLHGNDGIAEGLRADHDHGFAHSHGSDPHSDGHAQDHANHHHGSPDRPHLLLSQ